MDPWANRFEAVISEIEEIVPSSEERKLILRELYTASLWESLRDLSNSYRNGLINQGTFDKGILSLIECQNKLDQVVEEVNF